MLDWHSASLHTRMIRLFHVAIPASLLTLMAVEILLAAACYLAVIPLFSEDDWLIYLLYDGGGMQILAAVGALALGIYFNDLYSQIRVYSRLRLVQQFCLVFGVAFLAQGMLSYIDPELALARWQMIAGSAAGLALLPAWRMLFDVFVLRVLHRQRLLFIGHNRLVRTVAKTLAERPHFAMEGIGYLAPAPLEREVRGLGPWLGAAAEILEVYERRKPERIVVGLDERRGQMPVEQLLQLRLQGVPVEDAASLYERVMWRVPIDALRPSQLIFSGSLGPSPQKLALQRAYSFLIALAGVIFTLPLMALIAAAVRLTSPGPAIYRQKRVGRGGRVFELLKFRSMYQDAEARSGAVWASENDPRVTPVGRVLRRLRLDELPQFFNVLKGEMAIVGPRPERPEFVKVLGEQIPFYHQRHTIPPGITGWAQINHRYGDTLQDTVTKLEYDLYYLKHLGFSLDLYIIFHTLKVMLLSRGAR
ncbi:MAG: sugar transferase [Bryobacteraceae bacterium]|nr:sugar transferase [Bryobacteraceae bacterium]